MHHRLLGQEIELKVVEGKSENFIIQIPKSFLYHQKTLKWSWGQGGEGEPAGLVREGNQSTHETLTRAFTDRLFCCQTGGSEGGGKQDRRASVWGPVRRATQVSSDGRSRAPAEGRCQQACPLPVLWSACSLSRV